MSVLQRLPFPAALALLAAGTAAGVFVSVRTREWWWIVVALVVVGVVGVLYLREYAKLPGPESRPPAPPSAPESRTPSAPSDSVAASDTGSDVDPGTPVEVDKFDPDYDPVAEADRLETGAPPPPAAEP